jgi:hypothetical protein
MVSFSILRYSKVIVEEVKLCVEEEGMEMKRNRVG